MKKNPLFKIHTFANIIEKEIERKLISELGISYSQSMILDFIYNNPEISQRQVAIERHITPAAVSRHIEVLEEMGFIERKDREENKREHIIIITGRGRKIASSAKGVLEDSVEDFMEDLSDGDLYRIDAIIEKLLKRFNE